MPSVVWGCERISCSAWGRVAPLCNTRSYRHTFEPAINLSPGWTEISPASLTKLDLESTFFALPCLRLQARMDQVIAEQCAVPHAPAVWRGSCSVTSATKLPPQLTIGRVASSS